jgi:hypothetical protein
LKWIDKCAPELLQAPYHERTGAQRYRSLRFR